MTGDDLFDLAAAVNSRQDHISFVGEMITNLKEHSDEWGNDNLASFLQGLQSFSKDMQGYYHNVGEPVDVETISWRMAAQMLLAASVYGN